MPARKVSERTLEFNFIAEFLEKLRVNYPKAFAYGYTTRHEPRHGLDLSIGLSGKILAAFQFKAPSSGRGNTYWFTIGNRGGRGGCANPRCKGIRTNGKTTVSQCCTQHVALVLTALAVSRATGDPRPPVYYAFPLIASTSELQQHVPDVLSRTFLVNVLDLPLDCGRHRVGVVYNAGTPPWGSNVLGPYNSYIVIHSAPIPLPGDKITTADKLLEQLIKKSEIPKIPIQISLSPEELKEHAKKILQDKEALETLLKILEDPDLEISYKGNIILLPK